MLCERTQCGRGRSGEGVVGGNTLGFGRQCDCALLAEALAIVLPLMLAASAVAIVDAVAFSHPIWSLGVRIEESWPWLGRIDGWWNGKQRQQQKQNLPLIGDSSTGAFQCLRRQTSLANKTMLTHRRGQFLLDRTFALIEGHPRPDWGQKKPRTRKG